MGFLSIMPSVQAISYRTMGRIANLVSAIDSPPGNGEWRFEANRLHSGRHKGIMRRKAHHATMKPLQGTVPAPLEERLAAK